MVRTSINTPISSKPKSQVSPQPTSMDISPNIPIIEDIPPIQVVEFEEAHKTDGTGSENEELGEGSSKSKKRKTEEPFEDWVELGEPIAKNKSSELKRIESKCEKLIQGMCINLDWCKSVDFFDLLDVFEAQGWVKLVSSCFDRPLSYRLMNEFVSTFTNVDGLCSSKVVGVKIEFDCESLAELFEVPNRGYDKYFRGSGDVEVEGASMSDMVKSIGGNPKITKTNHKEFSALQKLLFIFVWRDIVPRSQHRHEANHLDAVLMYCLENQIQINFPSLMIQHLTHCITNNMLIGYGNLLSYVFESFGIDHMKHDLLKLQTNHYIQPKTLDSLGMSVVEGEAVFEVKKLKGVDSKAGDKEKLEKKKSEVVGTGEKKQGKEKEEQKKKKQRTEEELGKEEKEKEEKEAKETEKNVEGTGKKTGGTGKKGVASKPLTGRLGKFDGGTKRKSIRIALRPTKKKSSPTPVDLDESDDDKKGEGSSGIKAPAKRVLFGSEKLAGKGFAAFSSSTTHSEELMAKVGELDRKVDKLGKGLDHVYDRLGDIEEVLSNLVVSHDDLIEELKKSVENLTEGQKVIQQQMEEIIGSAHHEEEPDEATNKDEEQELDENDDDDVDA